MPIFIVGKVVSRAHSSSIPEGASIEINGEFIGTTPFTYELESRYAQEIWPEHVQIRARMPLAGYTAEEKVFEQHSRMQRRIQFILYDKNVDGVQPPTPQRDTTVNPEPTVPAPNTPGESDNETEWEEYQNLFEEDSADD